MGPKPTLEPLLRVRKQHPGTDFRGGTLRTGAYLYFRFFFMVPIV
jgi:hypothetical protein